MVAADGDELLADGTAGVDSLLAHLGVLHDALHLVARHSTAVCIATLAGVNKGMYASLKRNK